MMVQETRWGMEIYVSVRVSWEPTASKYCNFILCHTLSTLSDLVRQLRLHRRAGENFYFSYKNNQESNSEWRGPDVFHRPGQLSHSHTTVQSSLCLCLRSLAGLCAYALSSTTHALHFTLYSHQKKTLYSPISNNILYFICLLSKKKLKLT